ncbi:hypothetical protein IMZ31_21975 (plasmid) [Pontibacillus sp. ALD_SL1]|uniref:hypothetical protein n=1 Tax=Pontibacillus sp. ALD_SL1 TaxID=2777185 RepID=UPI001A96CAC9|nr:hypothetical protein [Pontibacillus sp. ALD_SL1]QST02122.1 hypothetical protein IMZ31_21975 [Pontibacillus sp. ALD_SL1]
MSLFNEEEQKRIEAFVADYDFVKKEPSLLRLSESNGVQKGTCLYGSMTQAIEVIKDYKDEVYVFAKIEGKEKEVLDIISFEALDTYIKPL